MISIYIWAFVLLCIFAFIGFLVFVMLVTIIIAGILEKCYRDKDDIEKMNASECPDEIER